MEKDKHNDFSKIHEKAYKKAKGKLPKESIIEIINSALKESDDKDYKKIAKAVAMKYKDFGVAYGKAAAELVVDDYLKNADHEVLNKLAKEKLGKDLADIAEKAAVSIHAYMKKDINKEQLISKIKDSHLEEVMMKVMDAAGIKPQDLTRNPEAIIKISSPVLAYSCFAAAYKELKDAQKDHELAREERLRIEEECSKSVQMIIESRKEMEERVSAYLSEHLSAFNEGFKQMDEAILANDTDGYIRGNTEIQKALGYNIQFTNQEEFDDLMDSDEAFRL